MPRPGLRPRLTQTVKVEKVVQGRITKLGRQTKPRIVKSEFKKEIKHLDIQYDGKGEVVLAKMEVVKMETVEDVKVPIIKEPKKNWLEIYTKIEAYRKDHIAPVDEFGCIGLGRRDLGDKVFRFETLVTLMLSAQTPDIKLFPTVRAIQAETPEGITPKALMDLGEDRIKAFLAKIGMQNQKSKALLGTSAILIEKYDSDIPPTFDALMELPGVGPKIAALTMSFAWNIDEAIGVDTHVHRISNRLGWVKSKNPEATRQQLEEWLPKDYWGPINPLLVGFGQTLCNALRPGCNECPVATLCPKIGIKSLTRKM